MEKNRPQWSISRISMKFYLRIIMSVIALGCVILVFVLMAKRDFLSTKMSFDEKSCHIYLSITNETSREILFSVGDLIYNKLDWRLCSREEVVLESLKPYQSPLILADHFPWTFRAHNGYQIDLAKYFPKLGDALTNSNVDCFIWHDCFWDESARKWIQKSGQINLRSRN
jgi:hypothetical protein